MRQLFFFFSCLSLSLFAGPDGLLLSGSPQALTTAFSRLNHELRHNHRHLDHSKIKLQVEILHFEGYSTDAETVFNEIKKLESRLQELVPVTQRTIPAAQMAELEDAAAKAAEELWPTWEKILPLQHLETVPARQVFWDSVSSRENQVKAVLRFALNSLGVAVGLGYAKGLNFEQATVMGITAGTLSGVLMLTNELYKAWLDSPFLFAIPTPHFQKKFEQSLDRGSRTQRLVKKSLHGSKTFMKDLLVILGYLGLFNYVGSLEGVSSDFTHFAKAVAMSLATETIFTAANSRVTGRAKAAIDRDAPDAARQLNDVLSASSTVALIQSLFITTLQVLTDVGVASAQSTLWHFSLVGIGTYPIFLANPSTMLGQFRDGWILPGLNRVHQATTAPLVRACSKRLSLLDTR